MMRFLSLFGWKSKSSSRPQSKRVLFLEQLEERTVCSISPMWFSTNLGDAGVRQTVQALWARDGSLSRDDMIAVFHEVSSDGVVRRGELADLRTVIDNGDFFGMTPDVENLSHKTVYYNDANTMFQGQTLVGSGKIQAGDAGILLDELVGKWFLGTDHPLESYAVSYKVAQGHLFGPGGPQPGDVMQGDRADCYFLSALAETALNDPQAIQNLFIANSDGTYTVGFHHANGNADYVTVDRMLPQAGGHFVDANSGRCLKDTTNVLWVALAEKAYAQLSAEGWSRAYARSWDAAWDANSYDSIDYGDDLKSLVQITGVQGDYRYFNGLDAQRNRLINQIEAHNLVTTWTLSAAAEPADMPAGIISNHVYAVIGYNEQDQTFILQNPIADWGDRILTLTWSQLNSYFGGWSWVDAL